MSTFFRKSDYHAAREYAQRQANQTKTPVGICATREYGKAGFSVQLLPRAEKRYGYEANCEVVDPDPSVRRARRRRAR